MHNLGNMEVIMKKGFFCCFLLIFVSTSILKGGPTRKAKGNYESLKLDCEALIDSIRNITRVEANIETIQGKASLFIKDIALKKDTSLSYLVEVIIDPHEDWRLRFVLTEIIPSISKSKEVAKELARILKNKEEHPYLRGICGLSIGYMGRKEYVPVLIEVLEEQSVYIKERAIWGLDLLKDPRAIQPLIVCMDDSYYMVQVLAIQTLGRLKAREALEPLRRKLDADDIPQHTKIVKHKVIRGISDIGGPEACAILLNILKNERYGDLRLGAADGLRGYKNDMVMFHLIKALEDKDELLRLHAAQSLIEADYHQARDAIREAIKNTKSEYVKSMLKKLLEMR